MMDKGRLIIPLWGSVYTEKLVSMTLSALLAPGVLCLWGPPVAAR
jgi:hypothetical protein